MLCAALLLVVPQLFSCSTPAPAPQITQEQRVRRDNAVGIELATQLEKKLEYRHDAKVELYLRDLCVMLRNGVADLKDTPIGVMIIRNRDHRWESFALPGMRVYLSSEMLSAMDYENELAAAVALELGLVRTRAALNNLEREFPVAPGAGNLAELPDQPVVFFGPLGILHFDEEQLLSAIPSAAEVLYNAGFDLRGMVALLARYEGAPQVSPYPAGEVAKLLQKTREVIAQYAPLRNPIVRSDRFLAIRKRLHKL